VLGASYRGRVKETAFSGVFPTVDDLLSRGAEVLVHDPMFTDDELAGYGFTAYHLGDPVDAAILQADHPEYLALTPADLPGIRAFVDGRGVIDGADWPGVTFLRLGDGEA
jgi:UDP-N-acetyl-D-mannosaminuronate dehydrogenase